MLARRELLMYAQARSVVCVSEAFVRNLVSRGVPTSKISFVPNGVDTAMWTAGVRAKGRAKLDADESDIIVSYIGTVWMAHDICTVLDAARLLGWERPRLRFVIIAVGSAL